MVSDVQPKKDGLKRFARGAGIALIGMAASSQYMTTGKMPVWAPNQPEIIRRLKYLGSDQTKPFKKRKK